MLHTWRLSICLGTLTYIVYLRCYCTVCGRVSFVRPVYSNLFCRRASPALKEWRSLEFPDVSRENGGHVSRRSGLTAFVATRVNELYRLVNL